MADSTVLQASQQAIERWQVPALAVATSVGGERRQFQLGCDEDARFRIASITKPMTASLAVQLLDLDESTGIWPEEVRVRHLLAHVTGYGGEIGDLARFGEGDDALGAAVAELPSVERLVPLDAAWSYANTGYWLAGWLARAAERLDLRGSAAGARARPRRPLGRDLRVAEPRGHRHRGRRRRLSARPPARRADSSRPPRTSAASPTGSCGSRGRTRCACRSPSRRAGSTGSASSASAWRRPTSGATRAPTAASSPPSCSSRAATPGSSG